MTHSLLPISPHVQVTRSGSDGHTLAQSSGLSQKRCSPREQLMSGVRGPREHFKRGLDASNLRPALEPVCVPDILGALAVWRQKKIKKIKEQG